MQVFQGMLLFFLLGFDVLTRYRIRRGRRMTRKPDHSAARKITIVLPGLVVGVVLGTLLLVPVAGLIVGGLVILFLLAVWYDFDVIPEIAAMLMEGLWRATAAICDMIFPANALARPRPGTSPAGLASAPARPRSLVFTLLTQVSHDRPDCRFRAAAGAATPILFAALGELVVERAGVLNPWVEGMMIGGALAGFAAAHATGSPAIGFAVAAVAGVLLSMIFALLTQYLLSNPGRDRACADAVRPWPDGDVRQTP